uniref:Uncharacterized protein n=1 Tax=Arundo donax TaxID=35708 RepID=A0A0A9TQV4_ARUDO
MSICTAPACPACASVLNLHTNCVYGTELVVFFQYGMQGAPFRISRGTVLIFWTYQFNFQPYWCMCMKFKIA